MRKSIFKLINKKTFFKISFYGHLTFGFLILSITSLFLEDKKLQLGFVWSIIFVFLYISKFLTENGENNGNT